MTDFPDGFWRWRLWDPTLGDESTEVAFPINPREGGRPKRSKKISGTTSTQGNHVVFEGRQERPTAPMSGAILTQRHDKFLNDWFDNPHKVRITNHLGQQWWAYLEELEITPRNRTNNQWSATFTAVIGHYGWITQYPGLD